MTTFTLSPEDEQIVQAQMQSGKFASTEEVVREGLRLVAEREQAYQARLEELRRELDKGLAELDQGLGVKFDPEKLKRLVAEKAQEHFEQVDWNATTPVGSGV